MLPFTQKAMKKAFASKICHSITNAPPQNFIFLYFTKTLLNTFHLILMTYAIKNGILFDLFKNKNFFY